MTDIKNYVIAYTENNQYHEVIWHALSVKDALWSMEASYIDPADFKKVSNIKVYEVIPAEDLASERAARILAEERVQKLRQTLSAGTWVRTDGELKNFKVLAVNVLKETA